VRILDCQRYWAFIKAYFTCYLSLVGLYVVIDAFSNLDEFMKRADGFGELMSVMGRYYLVHQALYFDQLGGVISMMAAIFTVTWMQRNNEQLAMLAAGISTHRAIRPVLYSSVIVSFLSVGNQEIIIPKYAEEIQKSHDDDGMSKVRLLPKRYDSRSVMIHGKEADRATRTITVRFNATIPVEVFGSMREIEGKQATYIPADHPRAPLKGGWLIRAATVKPPVEKAMLEPGASILTLVTDRAGFPRAFGDQPLPGDTYFLHSNLSFKAMMRKPNWYQYASMSELLDGLADSASDKTELNEITLYIHVRVLRPILALTLLFMSLPLVLGGYGRNMFINLGFALGNSAIFYGSVLLCQYLGSSGVLPPSLAAWLPLFVFALLATVRWDWIRT
jgi:lipopolysaccharide export system permease protein